MSLDAATLKTLDELQAKGDPGRAPYYKALQAAKDPYGRLALGVVQQNQIAGMAAYSYALEVAKRYCRPIDKAGWITLSVDLMRRDFRARQVEENFDRNSPSLQWFVIRDYHAAAFRRVCGLPPEAWTAWIPLLLEGEAGDAQLWRRMLTEDFLVVAVRTVELSLSGWSRKVGVSNDLSHKVSPILQTQPPVVTGARPVDPAFDRCMKELAPERLQQAGAPKGYRLGAFYLDCLASAVNVVGGPNLPDFGVYGPDGHDLTNGDVRRAINRHF